MLKEAVHAHNVLQLCYHMELPFKEFVGHVMALMVVNLIVCNKKSLTFLHCRFYLLVYYSAINALLKDESTKQ
jgi:hypothetical protein